MLFSPNKCHQQGWAIRTSVSEDPQPQPQSLRFFEVEDWVWTNFEDFWGWGLHKTFEVFDPQTSKNLNVWGKDEGSNSEVFRGLLKKPRKNEQKYLSQSCSFSSSGPIWSKAAHFYPQAKLFPQRLNFILVLNLSQNGSVSFTVLIWTKAAQFHPIS